MKKFFLLVVLISAAGLFLSRSLPAGFCENGPSKAYPIGGLAEDEVISMDALRQKQLDHDRFLLIDARSKKSYDEGHLEGAILPLTADYYKQEELFRLGIIPESPEKEKALAEAMRVYPKDMPIITYCNDHCQASAVLVYKLKKLGFRDARAMEEGYQSWEKKFPSSAHSSPPQNPADSRV